MDITARYTERLSYVERKALAEKVWEKLNNLSDAVWYINKRKKGASEVLSACLEVQKLLNNVISKALEIIEKEVKEEIKGK